MYGRVATVQNACTCSVGCVCMCVCVCVASVGLCVCVYAIVWRRGARVALRVPVCAQMGTCAAGLYATVGRSMNWMRAYLGVLVVTLVTELAAFSAVFAGASRLATARVSARGRLSRRVWRTSHARPCVCRTTTGARRSTASRLGCGGWQPRAYHGIAHTRTHTRASPSQVSAGVADAYASCCTIAGGDPAATECGWLASCCALVSVV